MQQLAPGSAAGSPEAAKLVGAADLKNMIINGGMQAAGLDGKFQAGVRLLLLLNRGCEKPRLGQLLQKAGGFLLQEVPQKRRRKGQSDLATNFLGPRHG